MRKHHVKLRKKEREYLEEIVAKGKTSAKVFKRATGLLELDRGKTLQAVAETLSVSYVTVAAWPWRSASLRNTSSAIAMSVG